MVSTRARGEIVVLNEKGLHTRPSTELVKLAASFKSQIQLTYRDLTINAKSVLGILMLAAPRGAKIKILADGPDADQAVTALEELALHKFYFNY